MQLINVNNQDNNDIKNQLLIEIENSPLKDKIQTKTSNILSSWSKYFNSYRNQFKMTGIQACAQGGAYSFTISAYLSGKIGKGVKNGVSGIITTCIGVIMEPIFQKIGSSLQNNKIYNNNIGPFFNKIFNFNTFKPAIKIMVNLTITRLAISILTTRRSHILKETVNILKGTVLTFAAAYCLNKFTAQPVNPTTIYLSV